MRIGIVGGTGPAGSALAARLADIGYEVVLGSRSKYRSMEVVDALIERWPERELAVSPSDNIGAAECEFVVIATPWDAAAITARSVKDQVRGKVVLPDSKVAATLQHVPAQELGNLEQPLDSDILICSDDQEATDLVAEIVGKIPGARALDCGNLSNATAIEAFTAVLLQLNTRYRTRVALKLVGLE